MMQPSTVLRFKCDVVLVLLLVAAGMLAGSVACGEEIALLLLWFVLSSKS